MRLHAVPATLLGVVLILLAWAAPIAVAGGGCHPAGPTKPVAATGSSLTVRIDGCIFLPAIDRVEVGTRVTFENTSNGPHDVSGADYAWHSQTLEPGDTFAYTFNSVGLHPYSCSLHPGMAGIVDVVPRAARASTGDESPDPTPGPASATGDGDGVPGTIPPVAAGGFGLAVGAALVILLQRRRDRAA